MSDKKQFTMMMLIASAFVVWILAGNYSIISVNKMLHEDKKLADYPYPFRVLKKESDIAILSTLRSSTLPAEVSLKILFPRLEGLKSNHPSMMQAQKKMALMQARAQELVIKDGTFKSVHWELDENWLRLHNVRPTQ